MKAQTYIKAGILLSMMLAALAGFIYLYKQSTSTDVGRQEHMLSSIYNLKQVDANWTAEVLKSYVGLTKDYDSLSNSSKHLPHLLSNLSVDLLGHSSQQAQGTRQELDRMIREKSQLVEKFKRRNAILRNSLRYLPTAQQEITSLLGSDKKSAAASAQGQNERLASKLEGLHPKILEKGQVLTRHVNVILGERLGVSTLVARINELGVTEKLNTLSTEISINRNADLDESTERGNIAAVYGTAMLLFFIVIGFWTARRIVKLNEITKTAFSRMQQLEQQLLEKSNPQNDRRPKTS
ncbi:MAG: hypothetical protein HYZ45_02935 [Burkholderiales bacterium]|nr:hypothetical protein [Burkholderiales bacterium]